METTILCLNWTKVELIQQVDYPPSGTLSNAFELNQSGIDTLILFYLFSFFFFSLNWTKVELIRLYFFRKSGILNNPSLNWTKVELIHLQFGECFSPSWIKFELNQSGIDTVDLQYKKKGTDLRLNWTKVELIQHFKSSKKKSVAEICLNWTKVELIHQDLCTGQGC